MTYEEKLGLIKFLTEIHATSAEKLEEYNKAVEERDQKKQELEEAQRKVESFKNLEEDVNNTKKISYFLNLLEDEKTEENEVNEND